MSIYARIYSEYDRVFSEYIQNMPVYTQSILRVFTLKIMHAQIYSMRRVAEDTGGILECIQTIV